MTARISDASSKRSPSGMRGFSLIEAMVTLLILSIAGLGMAGLQTVTLRNSNSAWMESSAATLAQDLVERMRANPGGDYATLYSAGLAAGNVACDGAAANCDSTQMANYDLTYWKCSLGATALANACNERSIPGQLPDGQGAVDVVGSTVTIRIRWFDSARNASRELTFETVL